MPQTKQRIGIMGGTFDPIHIGHLVTADAVRIQYELDLVLFIPAGNPPHKQGMKVTDSSHRYAMTLMATLSNPHFQVSAIETERPGPSYTIDTVQALRKNHGEQARFYFITGTDAVQELPTWGRIQELLEMCDFVAATRPGCVSALDDVIRQLGPLGRTKIHPLATPELEISSTDIRERVRSHRSIRYFVPESVEQYIYKEGLYRDK